MSAGHVDEEALHALKLAVADAAKRGMKVTGARRQGSKFVFDYAKAKRGDLALTLSAAAEAMPAPERRAFRSFVREQAGDPPEAARQAKAPKARKPAQGRLI